ncbi:MAG: penicillin-binding transpeptidase domain-containing protein [Sporomusaceae bacterium]|nr:penicillin-binding transpeptidase domain-containing protein [Sporomusaceae bacterium]
MRIQTASLKGRIALTVTVFLVVIAGLIGRIAWIQFVDGKQYSEKMKNQLQENLKLQSPRGTIFDRNGKELAVSSLNKSLYANPSEFNGDPDTVAAELAPIVNEKPEEIVDVLKSGKFFVYIHRTLEPEQYKQVKAYIEQHKLKGLYFVDESKRYYPNDRLAAQVLGFVGTDDVGLDGLEMSLDSTIKGKNMQQLVDTDNYGIPIFNSVFTFTPAKQVKNVSLTIDSNIQFIVEQCLDRGIAMTNARAATVLVMNPKTGEILAMASRPTFDPNHFDKATAAAWRNRALSIVYEPGSTFKSVVAAAALQEGLVYPDERFTDQGYVEVSGRKIQNADEERLNNTSFTDIIKKSLNTGFVKVGMRIGATRLMDYTRNFGFGKPTGIELPGEEQGILFNPADMRPSDLATMSIGQSIAVTPLQLITAVSAIANDGLLLKPHIIKAIYNPDGSTVATKLPDPVRQVITPETAHTLVSLLEKVVSEGGGVKAQVKGYHFAGKTGTAQRLNEKNGGYEEGHYISSFVGFGPVEDPALSVLVVLDDTGGDSYYGGQIAAPVFSDIMTQLMRYLEIRPIGGNVLPQVPPAQTAAEPKASQGSLPPVPPGKILVPSVAGKTIREAGQILANSGLCFIPIGSGTAVNQNIAPNRVVEPGAEVVVIFE